MKKFIITLIAITAVKLAYPQQNVILYTDYEPDLCISALTLNYQSDTLKVDFDNDGIIDLRLYISRQTSVVDRVATTKSSWLSRDRRNQNDSLVPGDNWQPANYEWGFWFYDDPYNLDLELGFRKVVNNENYYAWVNIHATRELTSSNDKIWVYLDKYAYCTIPNYPLRWEQTSLEDVGETNELSYTIHPNPTTGLISITGENLKTIEVANISGQKVFSGDCDDNDITIDLSNQPSGIYFISINDEKGRKYTRKVVKD